MITKASACAACPERFDRALMKAGISRQGKEGRCATRFTCFGLGITSAK
jgi:hypothetical protein